MWRIYSNPDPHGGVIIWSGIHSKASICEEIITCCGLQFDISIYRRRFIYHKWSFSFICTCRFDTSQLTGNKRHYEKFHICFVYSYLLIDWLFIVYVPLKNISLIWRRHHYRWRIANLRLMLGAQGLWAGRDLYRATPAVTRDLDFSESHPKDRPIQSPLIRHTRGCGSILTRILTGQLSFWH
jgi:hypothetical protein